MSEKQKTIRKPVTIKGKGLHTGLDVELTFKPAPENYGYKFKRVDLDNQPIVHAIIENVDDTSRGTSIKENGIKIGTIEHVLSAIYGLEIDNILMEINAQETPILDGSAKSFVDTLLKAGIVEQKVDKNFLVLKNNIAYYDEKNETELKAFPDYNFSINVLIDYDSSVLVNQYASLNKISDFKEQVANCRTFVFLHELEYLLKHNLIKGGNLENAIVIVDRDISQKELNRLADLFNKPRIQVQSQGILNNIELYFNNEPARHKLLDLLGDLALIGQPIKGKILATRPGHFSNIEFAKKIKQLVKKEHSKTNAPDIDLTAPPLMDVNQIKKILPHRPPFLFVDKILKMSNTDIIGLKNVTMNESFFIGHFPDDPVMPGVIVIEAMAQVGGVLVLSTVPDPENYLTYFLKMDKVKFRGKVVAGDTIIFKCELISPIRRGIANMHGQAFVGNNIVAEGELLAQIVKKE